MPSSFPEYAEALESSRTVTTEQGGSTVVWRIWGEGRAVVLMHGGSGSWSHWIRNVGPLSRDYAVLVPDIPGFGLSGSVAKDATSDQLAAAIVAGFRDIRGDASMHALIGFSFGGVVAGGMARQCLSDIGRLILVGASGLGIARSAPDKEMLRWRGLETRDEILAVHRHNLSSQMICDESRIDDLAVLLQDENTRHSRLNSRPISRSADLASALAVTDCALSGIWGEHDATARGGIQLRRQMLRQHDPDSEFSVVPGAGHWVAYEAHDTFNAIVLGLLASPRKRGVTANGSSILGPADVSPGALPQTGRL